MSTPVHFADRRRYPRRLRPPVSVVIPARNEAPKLPPAFSNLPEDLFEVILVDGSSTDRTVEVARFGESAKASPRGSLRKKIAEEPGVVGDSLC